MAFRADIFCRVCQELGSQVDDIELSVRLAEMNIPVHYFQEAKVLDPKVDSILGLARQRGRWLKGQRQIWKNKQQNILKLLRSGLPNWSLIHAMLLKPKTALVFIKVLLICILIVWPFNDGIYQLTIVSILISLLIDLIYYLIGLEYVTKKWNYLSALVGTPLLIILWGISWFFSILPAQEWLRAREK